MGATGYSSANAQRNSPGFMALLSSAACEWFLIFLMFVDAALSHLLIKFAYYCELQAPCLLCSRLESIFGNKEPQSYRSLLCSNHRVEISSLINCHIHGKLADVHGLCEECLMSLTTQSKPSNLVDKMGANSEQFAFPNPYIYKNFKPGFSSTRTCSCCNKPRRAKLKAQRLIQLTPMGFGASRANVKPPLPRVAGRSRLSQRESLRRMRDKMSIPVPARQSRSSPAHHLSHVGYTELKVTSDTESEVPFSDDDDGNSIMREKINVQHGSRSRYKSWSDDITSLQPTSQAFKMGRSLLDQCVQLDASDSDDVKSWASDSIIGHSLAELNWEQIDNKSHSSALPELISLDDFPLLPTTAEVLSGASTEKSKANSHASNMSSLSAQSELLSLSNSSPSPNVVGGSLGESLVKSHSIGTLEVGHKPVSRQEELLQTSTMPTGAATSNNYPSKKNDVDPSDASKLEALSKVSEQLAFSSSSKVDEVLKLLPQNLSIHEMKSSLHDTSSSKYPHEELQRHDAPSPDGNHVIQTPATLERDDSGFESLEEHDVGEVAGESVEDRLKRQVEYGRKFMKNLYKELEEERNASAVAANQAMAMITRLQQEKAALQMEALQYLRMMEEQAEYDMEALQKANDTLAEREKEMQDLEAELELYRSNLTDESTLEMLHKESDKKQVINEIAMACVENGIQAPLDSTCLKISEGSDKKPTNVMTSLLDFEDEKLYILQCLKKIERKLRQVSDHEACRDTADDTNPDGITAGDNQENICTDKNTQTGHSKEENNLSENLSSSNGSSPHNKSSASEDDNLSGQKNDTSSDQPKIGNGGEINLAALGNEISKLNNRLEALEADRIFLEHAYKSLQTGNEGLHFIEEIAQQLRELRKFGHQRSSMSVH